MSLCRSHLVAKFGENCSDIQCKLQQTLHAQQKRRETKANKVYIADGRNWRGAEISGYFCLLGSKVALKRATLGPELGAWNSRLEPGKHPAPWLYDRLAGKPERPGNASVGGQTNDEAQQQQQPMSGQAGYFCDSLINCKPGWAWLAEWFAC